MAYNLYMDWKTRKEFDNEKDYLLRKIEDRDREIKEQNKQISNLFYAVKELEKELNFPTYKKNDTRSQD